MDKQLATVRIQFVAEVGEDVIRQLLDDFLKDGVLNDEEHESLVQENGTRMDQAGCLIKMVLDKGPGASEKLLSRLKERDVNLFNKLSLGSVSPESSPKLSEQEEKSDSSVLKTCTEQMKKDVLEKAGSIYITKEKSERKRLALLINNMKYKEDSLVRLGADKDEERMEKLLKDLDYEVVKRPNLTGQKMDEALEEFSKCEKHKDADSTFVVIMSHGEKDAIHGINHNAQNKDLFSIDKIYDHLKHCVYLCNKPKIIVIQACRGESSGTVSVMRGPEPEPEPYQDDSGPVQSEIKGNDFFVIMATTPGTKAIRHTESGSPFIQWFVETFNRYAYEDHIIGLFRKVMKKSENSNKQMACIEKLSTGKDFYLFPGL